MGLQANLEYWHKIEHFITFDVPKNDNNIKIGDYPWVNKKQQEVKYLIYLGVYEQKDANRKILDYLNKEEENIEAIGNNLTCLAILELDSEGNYIEDSFNMTTFPWAVMMLLTGKINTRNMAAEFNEFKNKLILEANKIFNDAYINNNKLNEFFKVIKKRLIWTEDIKFNEDASESCFYRYRVIKVSKKEDEIEENTVFLNSFFIDDIEKVMNAVINNQYGKAFEKYASVTAIEADCKQDVDSKNVDQKANKYLIRETSPLKIPRGRWPNKNDLSLMQQVAANICSSKLGQDEMNVFSINGPPGTGKTTLLRDIIADIVVQEADKLIQYNKPQDAFIKTDYKEVITFNGVSEYTYNLYSLDKKLHDNGILVASCNNNAVDNISKELPNKKEIYFNNYTEQYTDYFAELAKTVFGTDDVWGLVSASLGKKSNRKKFAEPIIKAYNSDIKKWLGINDDNYFNWEDIKEKYNETNNKIEKIKIELHEAEKATKRINIYVKDINNKNIQLEECKCDFIKVNDDKIVKEQELNEKRKNLDIVKDRIIIHEKVKQSWVTLLFNSKLKRKYLKEQQDMQNQFEAIYNQYKNLVKNLEELNDLCNDINRKIFYLKKEINSLNLNIKEAQRITVKVSNQIGKNYPENFWKADYKYIQTHSPWIEDAESSKEKFKEENNNFNIYRKLNDLRNELFFLALQVRKSFIIEAQIPFKNNLFVFLKILNGEISTQEMKKNSLINDLWHTFFLFVPVVSSTFASIGRLLMDLKEESIGWLLIDEAGQALPQMALGAVWRSKRAVIVGDPLQVEPVSTTPQYLLDAIAKHCDTFDIKGKETSVQSIADKINPFGAYIKENLWVGCPLRVHRRCEEPMFSISNEIAYQNKMVYGTSGHNDLFPFISKSEWIDVRGKSKGNNNHYVENQGNKVLDILKKCFNGLQLLQFPEVYIISPFTTVIYGLKEKMIKELRPYLQSELWGNVDVKEFNKSFKEWINESIGTVHTFQGKETNLVILCLGADEESLGAIDWAAKTPNILNVAVTRAKKKCVIIGDKRLWGDRQYFSTAEKFMREQVPNHRSPISTSE